MAGRKRQALAADLSQAAARFERWRQKRILGERIPEQLWALATELAGRHGVSRTVAVLKLDYGVLKRRLAESRAAGAAPGANTPPPSFVELTPGPLPPSPCEIEFSDASGSTLRVRLPAGHVPDLVSLVRGFREFLHSDRWTMVGKAPPRPRIARSMALPQRSSGR